MDTMEIAMLAKNCIKIKGKKTSLVIDPFELSTKTETDGVLLFSKIAIDDFKKISGQRLIIAAPGEYEVGGIKISGVRQKDDLFYAVHVDGLSILLALASTIERLKDTIDGHQVSLLYANTALEKSSVGVLSSSVVAIYGDKTSESMQAFSKESSDDSAKKATVSKFSLTSDKLPSETEIMFLQN